MFEGLEGGTAGRMPTEKLIATLRDKLPAAEVDYALEDALLEAGYASAPLPPPRPPNLPLLVTSSVMRAHDSWGLLSVLSASAASACQ